MDVSKVAAAETHEVLNYTLQAQIHTEALDELRAEIAPNLPWADDHFLERVGGRPLNPGVEWAHWPWGNSANTFRTENVPNGPHNPAENGGDFNAGFSHTYMERMWPKHANVKPMAGLRNRPFEEWSKEAVHHGVRYKYGDAEDVVEHLLKAPDSRQAYLPIWFPEDTGKLDVRVPCTLGYHFILRHGYLHCTYYIRSCDLYRHFRDDVYLTVRLQLWMIDKLRAAERLLPQSPMWADVRPGLFTMHVVSLHCFVNDFQKLFGESR